MAPTSYPPTSGASSSWAPTASIPALRQRATLLATLRQFFAEREVLEVQTPVLARYTVTDPQVDAIPVPGYGYLQTSPEAALKRLLCAGAPSLYQLGPAFRADEAGRLHAPEFTLLEWYRLGFSEAELRLEVAALVDRVLGPADYQTIPYAELLTLAEPRGELPDDPALQEDLRVLAGLDTLTAARVFIIDYPAAQSAMAALQPGRPELAARFELVIDGIEIANGYQEATDAAELAARFASDQAARVAAGTVVPAADPYLLAALAEGLPPCAGVALGVDRLALLASGADQLDAVLSFRLDPPLP